MPRRPAGCTCFFQLCLPSMRDCGCYHRPTWILGALNYPLRFDITGGSADTLGSLRVVLVFQSLMFTCVGSRGDTFRFSCSVSDILHTGGKTGFIRVLVVHSRQDTRLWIDGTRRPIFYASNRKLVFPDKRTWDTFSCGDVPLGVSAGYHPGKGVRAILIPRAIEEEEIPSFLDCREPTLLLADFLPLSVGRVRVDSLTLIRAMHVIIRMRRLEQKRGRKWCPKIEMAMGTSRLSLPVDIQRRIITLAWGQ